MAVTFNEAVERLRALDASETADAFEMGDIALEQIPIVEEPLRGEPAFEGAAGKFEDLGVATRLKELGDAAGLAWTTLRNRRFVSSRVPRGVRGGRASWKTYRAIAYVPDESDRSELFDLIQQPNPDRPDGRWTEAALKPYLPERDSSDAGGKPQLDLIGKITELIFEEIIWPANLGNDLGELEAARTEALATVDKAVAAVRSKINVFIDRQIKQAS